MSTKYSGKDFRLRVKISGVYYLLDGETSTGGTISQEAVDTTDKGAMPWRELTANCGLLSMSIKVSGFTASSASVSAIKTLFSAAFYGTPVTVQLLSLATSEIFGEGEASVISMQRGGDKNNAETYDLTIESAAAMAQGIVVLKVATPVFSPAGGSILTTDLITITCATSGATIYYTLDGSTPSAANVVDTSKWIGAWTWEDGVGGNTVTAAPGGALSSGNGAAVPSTIAPILATGGYLNSKAADPIASPTAFTQRSTPIFTDVSSTEWTIGFWAKNTDITKNGVGQFNLDLNGSSTSYFQAEKCLFAGTARTHVASVQRPTGNFYAWVFNSGTVVMYVDGVQVDTWTTASSSFSIDCAYFISQNTSNLTSTGTSGTYLDNIILIADALPLSAVVSLASGAMPSATGDLSGARVYTAPFTVPTGAPVGVYSVVWNDSGATRSGSAAAIQYAIPSTLPLPSGRKIYFEVIAYDAPNTQNRVQIGLIKSTASLHPAALGHTLGLAADEYVVQTPGPGNGGAYVYNRSPNVLSGTADTTIGTHIGILWDGVNGEFSMKALNTGGASQSVFSIKTGMSASTWYLCYGGSSSSGANVVQAEMFVTPASLVYAVPSGYEAGWSDSAPVAGATTAKAIGVKAGLIDSDIATAVYTVTVPVPSWSPLTLGPYVWLDATDSATITQSGGFVHLWYDKSGNNRTYQGGDNATNATRPTQTTVGGKNFVNCGPYVGSLAGKWVASTHSGASFANRVFAVVVDSASGGGFIFGYYSSVFGYPFHREGPGYGANASDPILSSTYADSRWVNGVFRMNGQVASPSTSGLSGGVDILIFKSIGSYSAQQINALNCDRSFRSGGAKYGEVLNWDDTTTLGTTDFEKIEGYLAHKFGIASKLPSGHPYKSAPP